MTLPKIRKLLPKLSKSEMMQLKVEVDFLTSASSKFLSPDQQLLYRNIVGAMHRRHVRYMPFNEEENHKPRIRGYDYATFSAAFEIIESFIIANFSGESSFPGAVRHQFYSILVAEAVQILAVAGLPTGIKGIVETLKDPEGVMDRAFPGYVRAGVLRSILG